MMQNSSKDEFGLPNPYIISEFVLSIFARMFPDHENCLVSARMMARPTYDVWCHTHKVELSISLNDVKMTNEEKAHMGISANNDYYH